jgi:hypothetical protein
MRNGELAGKAFAGVAGGLTIATRSIGSGGTGVVPPFGTDVTGRRLKMGATGVGAGSFNILPMGELGEIFGSIVGAVGVMGRGSITAGPAGLEVTVRRIGAIGAIALVGAVARLSASSTAPAGIGLTFVVTVFPAAGRDGAAAARAEVTRLLKIAGCPIEYTAPYLRPKRSTAAPRAAIAMMGLIPARVAP